MRRYILTGTPGAGKTSILRHLAWLGHSVVEEAATSVIAQAQAHGEDEPWTRASFLDDVVAVQCRRQRAAPSPADDVQFFDRSPVCTHALAVYLDLPLSPALGSELERVAREAVYEREVFFVRHLGFCEPSAARRISFRESLEFERVHEESYRLFGYRIVDVPAGPLTRRTSAVRAEVARLAPAAPTPPAPGPTP
ncbi:AAA family ATPase [Streptomyces sp. NPDC007088]|uniref:AAA family ATPase n=1 Tax=Streptomyces sp. NPDC007088 TaxID=3364773 RepID=UPI0036C3800F